MAEGAFRKLLTHLLEKVQRSEYALLPDTPSSLSAKKEAVLERLERTVKPFIRRVNR